MMNFRTINKAIIALLGSSAAGRFTVTGYDGQAKGASEVKGSKRNVQSYFQHGQFPKGKGRAYGSTGHDMVFMIGLTVSAAAQANLAVINQVPPAQPAAMAAALAGMRESAFVADDLMDDLFEIVYQILMDARNIDLGLSEGTVTDRWVTELKKDDPLPQGTLLVLTGVATFTCSTTEDIIGDTPVAMTEGANINITMPGDTVQKTEIER